MRARNIKPGLFKNEDLAEMGPYAQILFEGLWCLADREGKLEDRVKRIAAEIFPYYEPKPSVNDLLDLLQKKEFIVRYQTERFKLIKVVNFLHHQRPHKNEPESILPEPIQKKQIVRKKKVQPLVDYTFDQGCAPLRSDTGFIDSLIPDSLIPDSLTPDIPGNSGNGKLSPSSLADLWNKLKPEALPKIFLPISPKRTKAATSAIRIRPDPEFWKSLILSMSDTPFLLGGNDRGWKADFDFILEKYDKVYEGKYKSETRVSGKTIKNMQVMKEWIEEKTHDQE